LVQLTWKKMGSAMTQSEWLMHARSLRYHFDWLFVFVLYKPLLDFKFQAR
jgi:hypothetical protein